MREMAVYSLIRLALWVVIWWLLTLLDIGVALAGVLAALIAMLLSILFLNRVRDAAAMRWKAAHDRRRERKGEPIDHDAEAEDALLDDEDDTGGDDTGGDDTGGDDTDPGDASPDDPGPDDPQDEVTRSDR